MTRASNPDHRHRDAARTGGGSVVGPSQASGADFLFGRPSATLGLRWQWVQARADSEVFEFVGDLLTLETSDFDAPGLVVDVAVPIASRLDVQGGVDFSRASTLSNYRDFTDADGFEIEQTTRLQQLGLFGNVELALTPRGRAIGQYAWIPARAVPYVGAGIGTTWYRFEQVGDFVDFVDDSIFSARLVSEGWTPETHVFAGLDVALAQRIQLSVEARYRWASASMDEDFVGFDDIDLTDFRVSTGVQFGF